MSPVPLLLEATVPGATAAVTSPPPPQALNVATAANSAGHKGRMAGDGVGAIGRERGSADSMACMDK